MMKSIKSSVSQEAGSSKCSTQELLTVAEAYSCVSTHLDEYTREHSLRVARLIGDFSLNLDLAPQQSLCLEQASLLHDIGKIVIPRSVLAKSTELTSSERAKIQKHPTLGSDLILRAPFLPEVATIVKHHHEHFNGAGYPDGLAGKSIPVGARILAVIDSFDAMIADRPYRRALSARETLARLEQAKGTQLDPEIVDQFVDNYRRRLEL